MTEDKFQYIVEDFADIRILRYRLENFEKLTLKQKTLAYYLAKAALAGRDITFDQFGKWNILIRKTLEAIYLHYEGDRNTDNFRQLETYLKRVWFSNGIYHHYGCEKFIPNFTKQFFADAVNTLKKEQLPLSGKQTPDELVKELIPIIYDPNIAPVKVSKKAHEDIVKNSACNFFVDVTQAEVEAYYAQLKDNNDKEPLSLGLNTTVVKENGTIKEETWRVGGKYSKQITHIIYWLEKAKETAENNNQRSIIQHLIDYYTTGDLRTFNTYCIEWVKETDADIDFINGFIETYDDPLGLKGTWEGLVEYRDKEGTMRTRLISDNAQWFEDHSPIDPRFKKKQVKGVTANVICAAMLGGGEYPATAIGINLPNAEWIRAQHGSKSVTISNITEAYNVAARGNGMLEEFVCDELTVKMIRRYGDRCDELHTDLHECLGHGSGQLLPGTDPDALKAYGNTIEEARADLFALYYIADEKLVELGLLEDREAYKSNYYTYMMNGLMTQLVRIKPGCQIEEAHMRNRALIARWCMANGDAVRMVKRDGKTVVVVNDYEGLRQQIAQLLAEVQRIKSEGDYDAAKALVEEYGVKIDPQLHEEVLDRYHRLDIAPYKGFLNPDFIVGGDTRQEEPTLKTAKDIRLSYKTTFVEQMLEYSRRYNGN